MNATPALAATDPYTSGTTGYDVSYLSCAAKPAGAFGIVGVNHGRPFSANTNTCIQAEYNNAPQTPLPSFYMNSGYSGAYRKNITSACSAASGGNQAWAIGCSEASYSLQLAAGLNSSMWWVDVETANSWSTGNLGLNRSAIQGAADRLSQAGVPVGVYSRPSMWTAITGGNSWTPGGLAADWIPNGSCGAPFTNPATTQVWLTQLTSGGVDSDTAC